MRRLLALTISALFLAFAACSATAQTHTVNVSGTTASQYITDANPFRGQIFAVPAGYDSLDSVRFNLGVVTRQQSPVAVRLKIFEVLSITGNAATLGPEIYTGPDVMISNVSTAAPVVFQPSSPVRLQPGKRYAVGVLKDVSPTDVNFWIAQNDPYPERGIISNATGYSTTIQVHSTAVFSSSAPSAPAIPSLSEWAMILFAGSLCTGAAWVIYRRRTLAA